jgi:Tol biopolymer transport system component
MKPRTRVGWLRTLLVSWVLVLSTLQAHATFPGRNGRIAFLLGPDVYTMNADGSDVQQLTHLPSDRAANWEFWSPDGKQIVFNEGPADVGGVGEIWLMNADGSHQHLILKEDDFSDDRPSFTPDGNFVLFNRCSRQLEECAIYRIGVDGTGLTPSPSASWVSRICQRRLRQTASRCYLRELRMTVSSPPST